MFYFKKQLKRQSGIALVLSVLILANLMMIALVVSDVILRIGKSSQGISQSEIAYFAAETAIEKAIYQIEKNKDASILPATGNLLNVNANWQLAIQSINTIAPTCFNNQNEISFPADPKSGPALNLSCVYAEDSVSGLVNQNLIEKSNPFKVRLKPGKSFELGLNIAVPDNSGPSGSDFYPKAITIEWPAAADGHVIILTADNQMVDDTQMMTSTGKIPSSGQMDNSPDYRFRISNNSASDVIYTIAPNNASELLPVGISVTAKGYYDVDKKERIIIVERRSWEIY